jgi:hypothetical protein
VQGYCYNGACQKFPVVLGEFGSRMRDCRNRCAAAGCMGLELSVSRAGVSSTRPQHGCHLATGFK